MLKCKEVAEQASAYIDGEMGLLQGLRFRLHLAMCVHCRRFVDQFQKGIEMIRRLPGESVTRQQLDQVGRRIRQSETSG